MLDLSTEREIVEDRGQGEVKSHVPRFNKKNQYERRESVLQFYFLFISLFLLLLL